MISSLILASTSPHRAQLLKNAGLDIVMQAPRIDERALEAEIGSITPLELAGFLSAAKAREVANRFPKMLVIGCDQTLELDGTVLHKPKDVDQAKKRLQALSGKRHYLHSGVCLYRGEKELWHHVETATMWVRQLKEQFIDNYLHHIGEAVLTSVGVYQIEGLGIQLFDAVEGDYFTIIGLPLLPLLRKLRDLEIVA